MHWIDEICWQKHKKLENVIVKIATTLLSVIPPEQGYFATF